MAKVKLNITDLNPSETFNYGTTIKTKLTGNAAFTTPKPTLIQFGASLDDLDTKDQAYRAAKVALDLALAERDAAHAAVLNDLRQLGAYVESESGGDALKIQSAGFEIRAQGAPINDISQVQNLSVSDGDDDGEVDLQWDKVRGAKAYEIESSTDPNNAATWVKRATVTRSRGSISGLTSGIRTWFRVRAIGSAAEGGWSDPAVKTIS